MNWSTFQRTDTCPLGWGLVLRVAALQTPTVRQRILDIWRGMR